MKQMTRCGFSICLTESHTQSTLSKKSKLHVVHTLTVTLTHVHASV